MMENNTCGTLLVCLSMCASVCARVKCRRSYSSWKWQVLAGSVWRNVQTNQKKDNINAEQSGDKTAFFFYGFVHLQLFSSPLNTCSTRSLLNAEAEAEKIIIIKKQKDQKKRIKKAMHWQRKRAESLVLICCYFFVFA